LIVALVVAWFGWRGYKRTSVSFKDSAKGFSLGFYTCELLIGQLLGASDVFSSSVNRCEAIANSLEFDYSNMEYKLPVSDEDSFNYWQHHYHDIKERLRSESPEVRLMFDMGITAGRAYYQKYMFTAIVFLRNGGIGQEWIEELDSSVEDDIKQLKSLAKNTGLRYSALKPLVSFLRKRVSSFIDESHEFETELLDNLIEIHKIVDLVEVNIRKT
jgi:hypothetical protein